MISTIMPRGPALGITFQLPEQDKGKPLSTAHARSDAGVLAVKRLLEHPAMLTRRLVLAQGILCHD